MIKKINEAFKFFECLIFVISENLIKLSNLRRENFIDKFYEWERKNHY